MKKSETYAERIERLFYMYDEVELTPKVEVGSRTEKRDKQTTWKTPKK